ncbi:uncharacterized protein LOC134188193 [Corticium candelabrum]|uniref:uncharacterized protein LOC134188193 n=1 Tax=Corticium candelabrum TaxID=121492 RepID=UPI002E27490B|nr:uncharacterized protein LOC134188193 [Corticium candelabrum]
MLRLAMVIVFLAGCQISETLQCYDCGGSHFHSGSHLNCNMCRIETCLDATSQCLTKVDKSIPTFSRTTINCSKDCAPMESATLSTKCCSSNLCNRERTGCSAPSSEATMTSSVVTQAVGSSPMPEGGTGKPGAANRGHEAFLFLLFCCLVVAFII